LFRCSVAFVFPSFYFGRNRTRWFPPLEKEKVLKFISFCFSSVFSARPIGWERKVILIRHNIGLKGSFLRSKKFGSEKPARFRSPLSPVIRVFSKRKPRFSATFRSEAKENRRVKFSR
jgi:hypothetical protein